MKQRTSFSLSEQMSFGRSIRWDLDCRSFHWYQRPSPFSCFSWPTRSHRLVPNFPLKWSIRDIHHLGFAFWINLTYSKYRCIHDMRNPTLLLTWDLNLKLKNKYRSAPPRRRSFAEDHTTWGQYEHRIETRSFTSLLRPGYAVIASAYLIGKSSQGSHSPVLTLPTRHVYHEHDISPIIPGISYLKMCSLPVLVYREHLVSRDNVGPCPIFTRSLCSLASFFTLGHIRIWSCSNWIRDGHNHWKQHPWCSSLWWTGC